MIAQFGDAKVYHPDELLELTDPVGSARIPCRLIRRIHPSNSEFFYFTDSQYLDKGVFIIEEFSRDYEINSVMFCDGTVCLDDKGRPSWWRSFGADWRKIDDEF